MRSPDIRHWLTCPSCGHKLFAIEELGTQKISTKLEIKCHSCRHKSLIIFYDGKVKAYSKEVK